MYGRDGWESNPPHAVLETASPALEHSPLYCGFSSLRLQPHPSEKQSFRQKIKVKRGPSTVAARSRTSPLGESNTRPGPLVRDHPGWHNPRLDCHTPRPDDCAPKSRSPEFARLYRAGRIFRCSFQQGMELKVGLEPTTYALRMRRSTN